jgi:YD repeat-containing protein
MENGMDITYLWGYIGTYPIAKIENASYADVKSVLGINDEAIRLLTEVPQNLRTLLPNAFITTYTYKPGVGIISTTDPKGIISKFEYDVLGRLKLTKDQNNKIISENQYNYKHEN